MENRGISEVVGVILVIMVLSIGFVIYQNAALTQSRQQEEVIYRDRALNMFLSLKNKIDMLENQRRTEVGMVSERYSSFFFTPPLSYGILNSKETSASSSGYIAYFSQYFYHPNFSVYFEDGALILSQAENNIMLVPPVLFDLSENNPDNYTFNLFTAEYRIKGSYNYMCSGSVTIRISAQVEEGCSAVPMLVYTIIPEPLHLSLWEQFLLEENKRLAERFAQLSTKYYGQPYTWYAEVRRNPENVQYIVYGPVPTGDLCDLIWHTRKVTLQITIGI